VVERPDDHACNLGSPQEMKLVLALRRMLKVMEARNTQSRIS
jgi:hypothetical protein